MILNLLAKPFTLLDNQRNRLLLVGICLVYCILFLNLFVPFNINRWLEEPWWFQIFGLSSFGIIGSAILAISQLFLRRVIRIKNFKVYHFLFWFIGELLMITLILTFIFGDFQRTILSEFLITFKYAGLVYLLPYSFGILVIAVFEGKKRDHKEKEVNFIQEKESLEMVPLPDEKGVVKLTVRREDLLYLQATDNYVSVYLLQNGSVIRKLVRNSLKNLDGPMTNNGIVRCHRSYMVNLGNMALVEKSGRHLIIRVKHSDTQIPVSRNFAPSFQKYIRS